MIPKARQRIPFSRQGLGPVAPKTLVLNHMRKDPERFRLAVDKSALVAKGLAAQIWEEIF
jgi:hypothetical protein